jgi:hypothetical protein
MRPIPFVQSDPVPGAKRMDARRGEELLRHLAAKSQAILDEAFVNEEWRRYCEAHKYQYLSVLHGHNRLVRRANRRGHITSILYDQRRLLSTRNVVCCETHREALETIFKAGLI